VVDLRQNGFYGGEIGPQLWGRTDSKQYAGGVALMRNSYITRFSGVQNRAGTTTCGATHTITQPSRMEPFAINASNGFMLEFSADGSCTPWLDGAQIDISGVATAYNAGTAYTPGQIVTFGGVYYWAWVSSTGATPTISPSVWFPLNGSKLSFPLGASTKPGISGTNVFQLQCVQQNDVMIVTHQSAFPFCINFFSNTLWTVNTVVQAATGANVACIIPTLTWTGGGSFDYAYVLTYIDPATGMESLPSTVVLATGAQDLATNPINVALSAAQTSPPNVSTFNVYRAASISGTSYGTFGFIGQIISTPGSGIGALGDANIVPDTAIQPPAQIPLFQSTSDYPACVGAYQGAVLFGNTINNPQTFWKSRIGPLLQFTVSTPVQDNDAIQATLAGRTRQAIQAFVDIGKLVIHTSHGEYVANGNAFGALTPTGINIVQQGYAGSQLLTPVQIGNTDIFVQARGNVLRDLRYEVQSFAYTGKDDTVYSPQLFTSDTIAQMAWQQVFDSIVWVAMGSGALLSMTYIREEGIYGWAHHDTVGGYFVSVCSVHEGAVDAVYVCVNRPVLIGGVWTNQYWIERFANREFSNETTGAIFTDASYFYDGRNTNLSYMLANASLTGGWTKTDNIALTLSGGATFPGGFGIGQVVVLQQLNPITGALVDQVNFTVNQVVSSTVVHAMPQRTVPAWAQNVTGFTAWGLAVTSFTFPASNPLTGQTITGNGDGFVVPPALLTGTTFTTTTPYLVVSLGLPVTCDIQTLPIENAAGASIAAKQARVMEITPIFYNTIGGSYGQTEADLLPLLWPTPTMDQAPQPQNGPLRLSILGEWEAVGQIWIRQSQPLPLGLTGIVVTVNVGN
jgi:hypothetical protein